MMEDINDIHCMLRFLLQRVNEQDREIASLRLENKELRDRLSRYNPPRKDSQNSDLPPSKELPLSKFIRKTRSLRMKSGRRRGGQPGHKGNTLEMQSADKIVPLIPHYCSCCGGNLSDTEAVLSEVRQCIDLPPVRPVVTEFRQYVKHFSCGCTCSSPFPAGVNSPVGYGHGVEQLVTYLSVYQHLPFKRLQELLMQVFHLKISTGTFQNILLRMRSRSENAYEKIRQVVSHSPVIGADETGTAVNGRIYWAWVWQTLQASYIHVDNARGHHAIKQVIPGGLPKSVLVTDCFAPYFLYAKAAVHQICTAHLLRELVYLGEYYKEQDWTERFTILLRDALTIHKNGADAQKIKQIRRRQQSLLEEELDASFKKLCSFQQRMIKRKENLFVFLADPQVPPDNNASERDIRGFKIKLKIAGCFRSVTGAQIFAQLQSIIKTTRKNEGQPFEVLGLLANNLE